MKYFLLILFLPIGSVALTQETSSGFEINLDFGKTLYASKNVNLNTDVSPNIAVAFKRNLRFGNGIIITSGFSYNSSRYIHDGYFYNLQGQRGFAQMPNSYKLNSLQVDMLGIPILFRKVIFQNENNGGLALGIGPTFSYVTNLKHRYQVNETKYLERFTLDKRVFTSLGFDVSTTPKKEKSSPIFGFGINYQVTHFLSDVSSYRPVQVYFRTGISF